MRKKIFLMLTCLFMLPAAAFSAIINGDFEAGDLTGWTVTLSTSSALTPPYVSITTPGTALETFGGLNRVHSGNYAAMLYSGYGSSNHLNWAKIEQSVVVPPGENMLETWFAAVLNTVHYSPLPAAYGEDTYVLFEVLDPSNAVIYSQRFSSFDNASTLVNEGNGVWRYLPWQQITVPLALYENQTLTIRYTSFDCNQGGHYSYGYIDDLRFVQPPTATPTFTATPTSTNTPTFTPTYTATPSVTETHTNTPTFTPTFTSTYTPTVTPTTTPTFTPTFTNTPVPFVFEIKGSFPNPAIYDAHIVYYLSRDAKVSMQVYDVSGEKVRYEEMEGYCGYNEWFWDARNRARKPVASGVYIIQGIATDPIYGGKYPDWVKAAVAK